MRKPRREAFPRRRKSMSHAMGESGKATRENVGDGKNDKENGIQASLWSVWENQEIDQNAVL